MRETRKEYLCGCSGCLNRLVLGLTVNNQKGELAPMELNEVTDLHNRRANISTVASYFKTMELPFLAWPEDKLLLNLTDLPLFLNGEAPRKAKTWKPFNAVARYEVLPGKGANTQIRAFIQTGRLYAVTGIQERPEGFAYFVTEYKFNS